MAFRPGKNNKNILSRIGRKSEGKMGMSDGVWECGKPKRFSIISMPQSEGDVYKRQELYPTISILPYLGGCHNLFVTFW